jgi:hypothetical protein
MFQKKNVRSKRPSAVQSRTSEDVKEGLEAAAGRLRCTESEVVHIILSHHFGYDPLTGLKLPLPSTEPSGPAGLGS